MGERMESVARPDDESPTAFASPTPDQRATPRPDRIGSIVLSRELGAGASGCVWFGRDEALARDVAVKLFKAPEHAGAHLDFDDGARRVSSVKHPNLAGLYAAGVHEGSPYLVMEHVPGWTLAEVSHRLGPLDAGIVAAIGVELCAGLAALHASDLAHRDIKPSNVMLHVDGRIVVTDFGLAVQRPTASLSAADVCLAGTPSYMAPEMFDGVVSTRTDVYAAGLTLAETLGARRLVCGDLGTIRVIHRAGLIDLDFVPQPLRETLQRCVQVAPLFRFKSALQLQQALALAATNAPNALGSLADRMRSAELPTQLVERPPSTRSSIEGALDRITEHRTRERETAVSLVSPPASPSRQSESLVPAGYFCTGCAYDLTGLSTSGACPECGASVVRSLDRVPVRVLGEARLRSLRRWLWLWSDATFSLGLLWLYGVNIIFTAGWAIAHAAAMALCVAAIAVATWGILRFPRLDRHDPAVRPGLVVGLWLGSGSIFVVAAVQYVGLHAYTRTIDSTLANALPACLATFLALLAWRTTLRRLIDLSQRTPPPTKATGRFRTSKRLSHLVFAVLAVAILILTADLFAIRLVRTRGLVTATYVLLTVTGLLVLATITTGVSGAYLFRNALRADRVYLRATSGGPVASHHRST